MTAISRKTLTRWATQHREEAAKLRERAARMVIDAENMERKAVLCERDAAEMEVEDAGSIGQHAQLDREWSA